MVPYYFMPFVPCTVILTFVCDHPIHSYGTANYAICVRFFSTRAERWCGRPY